MSVGLQVVHIFKNSFFIRGNVVCLFWVVERIITMEDIMKKSKPILSKTFTSALADMESREMDDFVMRNIKNLTMDDAQRIFDEHIVLSMEEIENRINLISSFILTRGVSGTTEWLSNFLIDSCMPHGKFSEEIAIMSSEVMRVALSYKRIQKTIESMTE